MNAEILANIKMVGLKMGEQDQDFAGVNCS